MIEPIEERRRVGCGYGYKEQEEEFNMKDKLVLASDVSTYISKVLMPGMTYDDYSKGYERACIDCKNKLRDFDPFNMKAHNEKYLKDFCEKLGLSVDESTIHSFVENNSGLPDVEV